MPYGLANTLFRGFKRPATSSFAVALAGLIVTGDAWTRVDFISERCRLSEYRIGDHNL
jgi:hypothetical protein